MRREVKLLIAEDDEGHASLIQKNLKRAGISNPIIQFKDGQEVLDFFFNDEGGFDSDEELAYLLLLDLNMPKVDGEHVLKRIKADEELRKMSVIVITSNDDPREVEKCHHLGCSNYITKPVDYDSFVDAVKKLGLFLMIVEVPSIKRKKGENGGDN